MFNFLSDTKYLFVVSDLFFWREFTHLKKNVFRSCRPRCRSSFRERHRFFTSSPHISKAKVLYRPNVCFEDRPCCVQGVIFLDGTPLVPANAMLSVSYINRLSLCIVRGAGLSPRSLRRLHDKSIFKVLDVHLPCTVLHFGCLFSAPQTHAHIFAGCSDRPSRSFYTPRLL